MENKQDFVITKKGTLTKYTGPGGDVTIPEGVTKIGERAFQWCTSLQSVTIPEGVTKIGERAFQWCTSLQSVTIPEGVTEIEGGAFSNCKNLTSVTIPEGVTEISGWAFYGCTGLTSISIAKGISNISGHTFSDTPWLKNLGEFAVVNGILLAYQGAGGDVTIPEGVTKIGYRTFYGCESLTSVTIPKGVTEIRDRAFEVCKNLTSVTIPEGITEINVWTFQYCESLQSVTIPEGVTKIGESAFHCCTSLQSVTIPESVTEIGNRAFSGCTGLTSATIPEGITTIHKSVFEDSCPAIIAPHIPIDDFAPKNKPGACAGFAKAYLDGAALDEEIKAGYLKYIKGQKKKLYPTAIKHEELLRLMAPHIPVAGFDAAHKPGACAGFAKAYLDGAELDEEIKAGYLKYIKGQKKRLFPAAIQHEELLRLMLAEKILDRNDIDSLLAECGKQNNSAAKAAVLDYAGEI